MTSWDPAASARLAEIAAQLRGDGVVEMMHEIVGHVWFGNVDRFDPTWLGDTNRSIGANAAENIHTLTRRVAQDPASWDLQESVRITAPRGSLLVATGSINLHVVKASAMKMLRVPDFDAFSWLADDSETRAAAATANAFKYNPWVGGRGTLFDGLVAPNGSAHALNEVFLLWAGGIDAPNTAAWLGLPTVGTEPWLAVEQLWWDETGTGASRRLGGRPSPTAGPVYSDGAAPLAAVTLKPRPKTAEQ